MGSGARPAAAHGVSAVGAGAAVGGAPVIRRAVAADVAGVHAIEAASFGDPWPVSSFASLVRERHAYFTVIDDGGVVIGYLIALLVADQGDVVNVAVAPAARRRGLGALLLDDALRAAAAAGAGSLHLDVRESNLAARALYASRGFVGGGRRRRYYSNPDEDALVLRRDL